MLGGDWTPTSLANSGDSGLSDGVTPNRTSSVIQEEGKLSCYSYRALGGPLSSRVFTAPPQEARLALAQAAARRSEVRVGRRFAVRLGLRSKVRGHVKSQCACAA